LNASHQGIAYFGYLAGYRLVHEAAQDPLFSRFLLDYMDFEATPTLRPLPGIDLDLYKRTLIERFSNGEVRDTIARLCLEASDRIPKWLVPVVKQQLQTGGEIRRSAAIIASWARYAEGIDEQGDPIEIVDNAKQLVLDAAAGQSQDPLAFIRVETFFGDLALSPRFVSAYSWALASLHDHGARVTLESLVADGDDNRVGGKSANS
jgi:mannitol 2-dehydrogenase